MIERRIHYCWFGGGEIPKLNQLCMETWDKLEGFELVRWDESNSPMDHPVVKYFYERKLWAFVSDFVRLHAVYHHGGIYLDTDVEVVRNFEPLLEHACFVAQEEPGRYNNCVIGAEKGHEFFTHAMAIMGQALQENEILISPEVTTRAVEATTSSLTLLPESSFFPYNPHSKGGNQSLMFRDILPGTYAIHHWAFSWQGKLDQKFKPYSFWSKLRRKVGNRIAGHSHA